MMRTESNYNKFNIILLVCLSFIFIGAYYLPAFTVLFTLIFLRYLRVDFALYLLCFTLLASLSHLYFNSNGYEVGDIIRYYSYFYDGMASSYPVSFVRFKLYQAYSFLFYSEKGYKPTVYGFMSMTLFLSCLVWYCHSVLKKINILPQTNNQHNIFLIAFFSLIPFSVYYSFENALAFSVFTLAIYHFLNGRYVLSVPCIIFSLFIHNATTPLVAILIFSQAPFLIRRKKIFFFTYISCVSVLIMQFSFFSRLNVDIGYVSRLFDKVNKYLFSFSVSDVSLIDVFYNIICTILILFVYLVFDKWLRSGSHCKFILRYHSFCYFYSSFAIPFLFVPTLGGRYIRLGMIFFIPYIYIFLMKCPSNRVSKHFVLFLLFVLFFSYSNLYFIGSLRYVNFSGGAMWVDNIMSMYTVAEEMSQ